MIEARTDNDLVLRLTDGEDLVAVLHELNGIRSAAIVGGIGMVRSARLGYWNGQAYIAIEADDPRELLSMQGTISVRDGKPAVHCHVALAARDGTVRGGHLTAATVHNTAEIVCRILTGIVLERRPEASGTVGLYPRTTS